MTARKRPAKAAPTSTPATARPRHSDGWNVCPTCGSRSTGRIAHQSVTDDKGRLVPCPER